MSDNCCIIVFPSTHSALRAERVAKREELEVGIIPVPRKISADCNMGMKVSMADKEATMKVLRENGVECRFVDWKVD